MKPAPAKKPPKPKKCRCGCGQTFIPRSSTQVAYGLECALKLAEKARVKREAAVRKIERKAIREAKEKIKTRRDWMKEAQAAVNEYVRERDKALPCISCGRHHQGQWHAGHYLSRGAHPELALDPRNIHKQCAPCNNHLSGNQVKYRAGLIERHGVELVEWLEGRHDPKRYAIDELKAIRDEYRAKTREFKKFAGNGSEIETVV